MSTWRIDNFCKKPTLKNAVLIEGLPGIGNVGKVATDFIVDELNAKKLYEITSDTFPHSVFVNKENLVELPRVEVFYKRLPKNDLLLVCGDVQPIDEISSYEFTEKILDLAKSFAVKEIITLGGIGLAEIPKKPKVYCTGNSKKAVDKYKGGKVHTNLYGTVGPIVGVSGLLLGLSSRRKMDAVSLLAETYGHPMYLGVKGAREILKVLNHKLDIGIEVDKLEKEIKHLEEEIMKKTEELGGLNAPVTGLKKQVNYIG
jgi:hypothetical protein